MAAIISNEKLCGNGALNGVQWLINDVFNAMKTIVSNNINTAINQQ